MVKGVITDIQRYSIEDGPGNRTTVFMKGCPLRCLWCQNPETWNQHPEIVWYDAKCVRCGRCIETCPKNAIRLAENRIVTDRKLCVNCGKCAEVCLNKARELKGKLMTADEVLAEVEKDRVFYETSGGGVTASGGEPTMQPEFLIEFFKKCKEANLHTTLDTCGYVKWETLEKILPYVDLVLYDLKEMNPAKHISYTGVEPYLIWENLKKIDDEEMHIWIRTPLIPKCTDEEENIRKIAEFISELNNVERWDLLPYNKLGMSKYAQLDREYPLKGTEKQSEEHRGEMKRIAESYDLKCKITA